MECLEKKDLEKKDSAVSKNFANFLINLTSSRGSIMNFV